MLHIVAKAQLLVKYSRPNVPSVSTSHIPKRCTRVNSNPGKKLARELLDVVTAGPKMRKWYGQESALPRDGGAPEPEKQQQEPPRDEQQQQPEQDDGVRDTILVTDADTPTGELIVLQLILLRAKIRILVKDTAAAKTGYGPYVEPMSVDINSPAGAARALRNVRCVIVLGKTGAIPQAAKQAGVDRLVLLSTAGMPQQGGLAALFQSSADATLKEPQREAAVLSSGLPHVIVKTGVIQDVPGGNSSIAITPSSTSSSSSSGNSSKSAQCSISREDLASAVVASAVHLTAVGSSSGASGSIVFEVRETGQGRPPENWEQLLDNLVAARV